MPRREALHESTRTPLRPACTTEPSIVSTSQDIWLSLRWPIHGASTPSLVASDPHPARAPDERALNAAAVTAAPRSGSWHLA